MELERVMQIIDCMLRSQIRGQMLINFSGNKGDMDIKFSNITIENLNRLVLDDKNDDNQFDIN